jgi:quinol monooxygenase YgiN
MFIAIVDFATAAADRPAALAQLDGEGGEIRAMPGNLAFRVYAARDTDTAITVVHEWADEGWRRRARPGCCHRLGRH